jgi:ABC-type Mn2+/Zn2+ transport system ATPase subunit
MPGATGSFKSSRLVGVMGPSGSGKSTFLNAVAGRASYGKIGGEVRVNGKVADMRLYRADIGFVPQVRQAPQPRPPPHTQWADLMCEPYHRRHGKHGVYIDGVPQFGAPTETKTVIWVMS